MLSLETHLGVTASPQAPFPTDYVTLPVSASHRRFGSLPLAAEEGHVPLTTTSTSRNMHSRHAQATCPPYRRASLAGRTVGKVGGPSLVGALDGHFQEQIRADAMRLIGLAGARLAVDRLDAHAAHERAHVPAPHHVALVFEQTSKLACAQKRMLRCSSSIRRMSNRSASLTPRRR